MDLTGIPVTRGRAGALERHALPVGLAVLLYAIE